MQRTALHAAADDKLWEASSPVSTRGDRPKQRATAMDMQTELAKLEARIDEFWVGTDLPYADWRQSVVAIVTVVEDSLRIMGPAKADNLKYVLRSLLELSRLKCVSHLLQPPLGVWDTGGR